MARVPRCAEIFAKSIVDGTPKGWDAIEAEELNGQKLQGTGTAKDVMTCLVSMGQADEFPLMVRPPLAIPFNCGPARCFGRLSPTRCRGSTEHDGVWLVLLSPSIQATIYRIAFEGGAPEDLVKINQAKPKAPPFVTVYSFTETKFTTRTAYEAWVKAGALNADLP